ncbi:MAG: amidophosphoribosyltransferase, partial [Proteobacteria bacterium]|nr:amidophosphoribosyltransferase [Pseudomonadota bacterium]
KREIFLSDRRHINTNSDSEVLLNVLAHEMEDAAGGSRLDEAAIFRAVVGVYRRCRGAYAAVAMIAGYGLLAFRDPYGIRPLVIGKKELPDGTVEWLVASESVALDTLGFRLLRDLAPGEAVLIDTEGNFRSRVCAAKTVVAPCMFEYVYLARPDSIMDGVSVYEARLKMGEFLAEKMKRTMPHAGIDVVIPIPDSSRPSAQEMALRLGLPYREGFVKNRYIGRTFIMPGQSLRKKSVRQKLNTIHQEFKGKSVLLVDDSIVRGTTSKEIINMAREAGAAKVYMASAAPPVRHANVYGIDMPTRIELIANGRTEDEIRREIGADGLLYQNLDDLKASVRAINPVIQSFETSCFDGDYITGDITPEYLSGVEKQEDGQDFGMTTDIFGGGGQLGLNLIDQEDR